MSKPRDGKNHQRPKAADPAQSLSDNALWRRVTDSVKPLDPAAKNQINPDVPVMAQLLGEGPAPSSSASATTTPSAPQQPKPKADLSKLKNGIAQPAISPGRQARQSVAGYLGASGQPPASEPGWPLTGALSPGVDRRTASKLARGKYPIDATLDLHGDRQHQAQERLQRFIITSHQAGHRCLLVITGKGKRQLPGRDGHPGAGDQAPGVIRRRLVDWLSAAHLKPLILAIKTAQPKDGGEGAFYILLRRQR